jgi:hypothetical protein
MKPRYLNSVCKARTVDITGTLFASRGEGMAIRVKTKDLTGAMRSLNNGDTFSTCCNEGLVEHWSVYVLVLSGWFIVTAEPHEEWDRWFRLPKGVKSTNAFAMVSKRKASRRAAAFAAANPGMIPVPRPEARLYTDWLLDGNKPMPGEVLLAVTKFWVSILAQYGN